MDAAGFEEDGDSYLIHGVSGGRSRIPKSMIKRFESVAAEPESQLEVSLAEAEEVPNTNGLPTVVMVSKVITGDTLSIDSGENLRLIGIDTPETAHPSKPVEPFGKEASEYTRKHLDGERIRLVYDQANAATKHRDKYGRLLAYVHRIRDGLDFNAQIVKEGYAHAYTEYPLGRNAEFLGYQQEARERKLGMWARPTAE